MKRIFLILALVFVLAVSGCAGAKAHIHNWVAMSTTVYHDECGHYDDNGNWAVDAPGYSETYTTGYTCSGCGANKGGLE